MFYAMFQHQTQITDVECNVQNIVLVVKKITRKIKNRKIERHREIVDLVR